VWAIAFERGVSGFPVGGKVTVPIDEARFRASPFRTEAAGSVLEIPPKQGRAEGELTAADGTVLRWSLRFSPVGPSYRPYPAEVFYRAPLPRTKVITPCPDTRFAGEVRVGEDTWTLRGWPGMQGHNWGSQHSEPYVWAHANAWEGGTHDGVWLEAMASRVGLGPVQTPWLAVAGIHVDGRTVRFDGARAILRPRVELDQRRWWFRLNLRGASLEGEIEARGDDMAGLRYENPDGSAIACLNSKLARGRFVLRRAGRPELTLESERVALEIGTAAEDHGVRMLA
ncbi:MAG: hypothetical protein ACOCUS_05195, partial [Polyangiales bacterium]